MGMTVLPEHRCELIYLMSIVLVKDIDTNMHGLGLPFMPLEGAKIAKWRFWSVVLLISHAFDVGKPLECIG